MWNEAEIQYFIEVLGVQPPTFAKSPEPDASCEVLVIVSPQDEIERQLIEKILAAMHLKTYVLKEMQTLSLREVLELPALDILSFVSLEDFEVPEVKDLGGKRWWRLYPASGMLSENEGQNRERKKQVWGLLQTFRSKDLQ